MNLTDGVTIAAVDIGLDQYQGFWSRDQSYIHVSPDGSEVAMLDWSWQDVGAQAPVHFVILSADERSASSIQMSVSDAFWEHGARPLGRFNGGSYFMMPNGVINRLSVDRSKRVASASIDAISPSFGYATNDGYIVPTFGLMAPDGDFVAWNYFVPPPPSVQFWQMIPENASHAATSYDFGPDADQDHQGTVGKVSLFAMGVSSGGMQASAGLDTRRRELILVTEPFREAFPGAGAYSRKVVSMHFACPVASSGFPTWAVACIVAVSCVAVAGAVFVCLRKRRAGRAQEPLVADFEA